jgi:DNA-binding NarL/FixJ family response regulator
LRAFRSRLLREDFHRRRSVGVSRRPQDLLATASEIDVAGEASNGREAVERVLALQPDIVLMDIRMPVMDGIAATAAIRAAHSNVCVLVLTTFDEDRLVSESMRAGANGYLLKGTPIEDMLSIFSLALRGYTAIAKGVRGPGRLAGDDRFANLSPREREILSLLGAGMTNRDIASTLFLSEGTVKNYVTKILGTLGMRHRTEAALLWRQLN